MPVTFGLHLDMAEVQMFVSAKDPKLWNDVYALYDVVIKEKSSRKTKPGAAKDLIHLDKWYQNELPETIAARPTKHLTTEELVQLMRWKLSRGKFRPRLVELAGSNSDDTVVKASTAAFKSTHRGHLRAAIEALSKLRGIGPATASAVLAAGSPDRAAFMADEPTAAILGQSSLKYNLQEYMEYSTGVIRICEELNETDKDAGNWTPHKVELALWTFCVAKQLKPELLSKLMDCSESKNESTGKEKRKSCNTDRTAAKKKRI